VQGKDININFQAGPFTYTWIEPWAQLPPTQGWTHHGLVRRRDGMIVGGHPELPRILVFDPEGRVHEEFDVPVTENHGLAVSDEQGEERLWIVDIANKYGQQARYPVQLLKCTMKGDVLARLERKDFKLPDDAAFCITSCTVDPATGCLWVADGYGSHKVFRFSPQLELELTLDGTEGNAGAFNQPHSIWADTRKGVTELYISDRNNDRIQVYAPDGSFLRCLSEGFVTPSAFATFGDYMVVAELKARLVLLDGKDRILGVIGPGPDHVKRPGWPNRLEGEKTVSALPLLKPGAFNSPHGVCADPDGNIYISEWLIGGRWIKLARQ